MGTKWMANMNSRSAAGFLDIRPFWMTSCDHYRWFEIPEIQRTLIENINYFVVITVPVDVAMPTGVKTSTGTSIARYGPRLGAWPALGVVTHWGRYKMTAIYQTTFSNAFSWMKMYKFRLRFQWSLFPINIPALVQIMAWCRPGNKPFSQAIIA